MKLFVEPGKVRKENISCIIVKVALSLIGRGAPLEERVRAKYPQNFNVYLVVVHIFLNWKFILWYS